MNYKRLLAISYALLLGLLAVFSMMTVVAKSGDSQGERKPTVSGEANVITNTVYFPIIFGSYPITHDLTLYMIGDGRSYEVRHQDGSQERIQTQVEDGRFFHVKGENEGKWEEMWAIDDYIYRGTDTSPADDKVSGKEQYYTLRENSQYGSRWAPRYWRVGQIFERNPLVSFYNKGGCEFDEGGDHQSWLKFVAYYPTLNFPGPVPGGITLANVIQLAWLLEPDSPPTENYFYAQYYGLVGWRNDEGKQAYISEVHEPGTRPDIIREVIPCLSISGQPDPQFTNMRIGKLPPPNRPK